MYDQLVQTKNPGLILILIDQSGSMDEPYDGGTKKNVAALAINRCIYEIIASCRSGNETRNRCQIGVYGYGYGGATQLIGGWVSEVEGKSLGIQTITRKVPDGAGGLVDSPFQLQIYIEPRAKGSTPMAQAFSKARDLIETSWLPRYPDSFPPVVINITDGAPTDDNGTSNDFDGAASAAKALMALRSNNGSLLLFNAHISSGNAPELCLPSVLPAGSDECARFLFDASSELPSELLSSAKAAGLNAQPKARGFVYRAGAEYLTKLIVFGSMGITGK